MGGEEEEIRLAIVMNGGLSLAVWMGGVGHEIDLLRRASRVARGASETAVGGVATYDRQIFDKWVAFCQEHRIGEVFVDVVAGTSAGGLNGALLATAVARGVPLDPAVPADRPGPWLRELWLRDAAIEEKKLIRPRKKKPRLASVFDGSHFRSAVDDALKALAPGAEQASPEPVTLFVTATALGSSDDRYNDSFAQPFDVPDHRRLYRFRHSERDAVSFTPHRDDASATPGKTWWTSHVVDEFEDDSNAENPRKHPALVAAAHASASFPFAFEPVRETPELAARRIRPPSSIEPAGGQWLVDGGILDNAPFYPVLDAISRKPLTRPVRRLLVYVVPSSGTSDTTAAPGPDIPTWERIGASVINYPRESDLREDISMTSDLLTRAESHAAAPEARFRDAVGGDPGMLAAAESLLPQYRVARVVGGLLELRGNLATARPELRFTLAPRSVTDAENLLERPIPWLPGPTEDLRAAYDGNEWAWGVAAAERIVRLMVRDLRSRFDSATDAGPNLKVISECLNRIEAVRDAILAELSARAEGAPASDSELIAWTAELFDGLRVKEALAWSVRCAADAYARALPLPDGAASAVSSGLAVEVNTQAFTAYQPFSRQAPFELLRLGPDVETPLVDRDADPVEARAAGARKLYGTRLRHFAAFGLRDWRHWDWTAGRLDAQTHLARALIMPAGKDPVTARQVADAWTATVQELTIEAEFGPRADDWLKRRNSLVHTLGLILNSLLARRPEKRFARIWTPAARLFTRGAWKRKLASLGRKR